MYNLSGGFLVLAALTLGACAATDGPRATRVAGYHVAAKFAVGGAGGWDYISVDPKRDRIYASRSDHVQVIDAKTGVVVAELRDTPGVHGVAMAEEFGTGFTSNGRNGTVTVFDLESLAARGTIKVSGINPDAILYDAFSRRILTFNGGSASVTAIDARTWAVAGTVAVSGKPEGAVSDERGRVFVNIEDRNTVAVIDMRTLSVANEWPLGRCVSPTGLAIDRRRMRLFAVCQNEVMVVLDAGSGRLVQEVGIGRQPDGAEFDADLDVVLSSNGDGTLTIVKGDDAENYSVRQTLATQRGARTLVLDPRSHRVYLPTASFGPAPGATESQPRPRAPLIPDSFVVLVVEPDRL
jgi:hypothetical protein